MKITLSCSHCNKELGPNVEKPYHFEYRDDGRYEINCSRGHKSIFLLQQFNFELLFEIAMYAIAEGYYREAVSSFSSSLERFYEYCIRVLCKKRQLSSDSVSSAWKNVASQSERQLGAFIYMWLSEFGEPPNILSPKDVSFRNGVIHKGKIPTQDEAINYGTTVITIIRSKIKMLRETCSEEMRQLLTEYQESKKLDSDTSDNISVVFKHTVICLQSEDEAHNNLSVEDALEKIKSNLVYIRSINN